MKIFVLVKQVPDTETHLKITGSAIDETGIKWIVSPFDEHALEESMKLREKTGGEITAVSLGPERCVDALRTAFALGVNNAVHLKSNAYNTLDVSQTATLLARYLKEQSPDIILTGNTAIDSQSSMVPAMIAEFLGCSNITNAVEVNIEGNRISCKREIDGGTATMESDLPVIITATKSLNEPRYPNLKGIMASKKKKIDTVEITAAADNIRPIEILEVKAPPPRPEGRIIEGESPEAKAAELVRLLREEAKVI